MDQDIIYTILAVTAAILIIGTAIYLWRYSSGPTFVGCYVDKVANRAIPSGGDYPVTLEQCETIAKKSGDTLFGFQYGGSQGHPISLGQCWTGTDMNKAQQYGKAAANQCLQITGTNNYVVGPLVNAIYTL